jgi:hypothetical protein
MHTTYKTLNSFLAEAIPEFSPYYEEEVQKRGGHATQYIIFAALNAMVIQALDFGADPPFFTNVFDAFEIMAISQDLEVVNLLQVGFVQDLVRYPKRLATAWDLMGSATQKLTRDMAKVWNREVNLPPQARIPEKSKAQAT